MNCGKCGAPVDENPARELLECEHCGYQFSTPEHSELYARYRRDEEAKAAAASQLERDRLLAEERQRQAEQDAQARRKAEFGQTARRAASFTSRTVRSIILLALGLVVAAFVLPLVFQYGALRALGGGILTQIMKIPQLKGLCAFAPPPRYLLFPDLRRGTPGSFSPADPERPEEVIMHHVGAEFMYVQR